ncbi:MAG TPA: GntR family transcriptional regulator [Erysipelothrix sp.]
MIQINSKDPKPIFQQIIDQISQLIALNLIKADEQLPSVRSLAKDLAINPNTVARAYREAELQGLIYSIPGKGYYVNDDEKGINSYKMEAYETLEEHVINLLNLDETIDDIISFIKEVKHD